MPDFIRRFGEQDANGDFFLSSSRQSIITSLLSAGYAEPTSTFSGANLAYLYLELSCTRSTRYSSWRPWQCSSGALAQAFTSDRFGRRGSILIWAAIFTIGVAIQTGTTFSVPQITIGRFIAGLGVGALSGRTTCPHFSVLELMRRFWDLQ